MGPPLALSVGDPGGVGPEVALSAVARLALSRDVVLFGDLELLRSVAGTSGIAPEALIAVAGDSPAVPVVDRLRVVDTGRGDSEAIQLRAPSAHTGEAQWLGLSAATRYVEEGFARGLVTGPVSKEAINMAGHPFQGQTEFLARRAGLRDDDVTMMFLGPVLRVALVTTHLSVADVPGAITDARVQRAIRHLCEALGHLAQPEVQPPLAICGLNPHAGEGGLFGREEIEVIEGAIESVRALDLGPQLRGPLPAEAVFRAAKAGGLSGVVAMFHDQATIASKLLDWGEAVNVTWGLPFVRTSVDHGVAYDAAGTGNASDDGMCAALRMAIALCS
jgi:4-hydroxythreonine-4-phosphate dehydrogenase